jgi:aerobic carbon-monoxide dehydrogenase medium subunit
MTPFTFHRPGTLQEAVRLLARADATTKLMAGGQSLLLAMKERTMRPARILSLAALSDLSGIRKLPDGRLQIGATTTYAALERAELAGWHAQIGAVAGNLADRSVRSLGTIGGAVCQADPRFDMPTLLVAAGAQMHLVSDAGQRTVNAGDFFNPAGGTTMNSYEILDQIVLPPVEALDALAFEKYRFRAFEAAVVTVACALKCESDGRIARVVFVIGAVAKAPRRAVNAVASLVGNRFGRIDTEKLSAGIAAEVAPLDRAQTLRQRYQSELVASLSARAFARAAAQTGGK